MNSRTISAGLMLVAAFAAGIAFAQQSAPAGTVAKLTGVQGNVLVSQADAMAAAANEQRLAPGVRVITTAGASATVVYDKACNVALGENRRYTVREQSECAEAHAPPMGKAADYAVLAGARVPNVGETVVDGDLGVYPGTDVTGFPPGKVNNGSIHPDQNNKNSGDDSPKKAQEDAAKAYEDLVGQRCNTKLTGQDLGGLQLTPGVYCFVNSGAKLTGDLYLDAQGDPKAVFVFQIGTNLVTAPNSRVLVLNTGQKPDDNSQQDPDDKENDKKESTLCHVYWQVGGSAVVDRGNRFVGNILAIGEILMGNAVDMVGRALARNSTVTLDTDKIDRVSCRLVPLAAAKVLGAGAGAVAIGAGAAGGAAIGGAAAIGVGAAAIGAGALAVDLGINTLGRTRTTFSLSPN